VSNQDTGQSGQKKKRAEQGESRGIHLCSLNATPVASGLSCLKREKVPSTAKDSAWNARGVRGSKKGNVSGGKNSKKQQRVTVEQQKKKSTEGTSMEKTPLLPTKETKKSTGEALVWLTVQTSWENQLGSV